VRKFLAVDIGGTLLKYGVLTEDGSILEKSERLTEAYLGGPSIIKKVKELGEQLIGKYNITGICVSTAGQVDSEKGEILYASALIPNYTGVQLKKELESFFKLPVEVENDVNCAGLAESWIGTGKDARSLFCLTVGTGIGGSYILDNKLHTGHNFSGGEIGYIPIEGDQFESLASTKTLIQNVAEQKGLPEQAFTGRDIFEQAKNGDNICARQISRQVYYLSKGIATITYMMNPEMIIIGGGITAQKEYLYPLIMEQLEQDIMPSILNNTQFAIAKNLNNAGMIGALRNFLMKESIQPLRSIMVIIESNKHKLTNREQMIADYAIHNLASVSNTTISQLADKVNVSEATVTRFCKKLEFGTYNQFRLIAKEAFVSTRLYEQSEMTSISETNDNYNNMLKKFENLYQAEDIQMFKNEIAEAENIYLYGSNDMGAIISSLKYKLLNKGFRTEAFSNEYHVNSSDKFIKDDSLFIGISLSGYSEDVVRVLQQTKEKGVKTIGITSQKDSPLSDVSDLRMIVPAAGNGYNKATNMGEVSVYYLFDIIFNELNRELITV